MKKILIGALILMVLLGGVSGLLYMQKDAYAKGQIQNLLEQMTGFPVVVGTVRVDKMGKKISVDQIMIENPEGFHAEIFADIRDVKIDFMPFKYLRTRKAHFPKVTGTIEAVHLERNEKGGVNLRDLKALSRDFLDRKIDQVMRLDPKFLIDRLEIRFGTVEFKEWSQEAEPALSEVDFEGKVDVYGYVTEPELLIQAPVVKILGSLNRGALGIPRGAIQRRLIEISGRPRS